MGRKCGKYGKSLKQKLCMITYRKKGLARCLCCLQKSFCEIYTILNAEPDSRKKKERGS